jgi:cobalt-zinc-cadmium efflux system outer membrane protein
MEHFAQKGILRRSFKAMNTPTLNHRAALVLLCVGVLAAGATVGLAGAPVPDTSEGPTGPLSRREAVQWGLERNPELAALRQQHGIAAAAVVIANTYPHNPTWEARVRNADGPISATITNRVPTEQNLIFPVEIRGQRTFRRQDAAAGLSRTDWEIADQELDLAVRVIRAFDTVLYHEAKLRVLEETLRVNEQSAGRVKQMVEARLLAGADLILSRAEVDDTRALASAERAAVVTARSDLRRALGTVVPEVDIEGALDAQVPTWDAPDLIQVALTRRPDMLARRAAVREAEAKVRLAVAERIDNPTIGPSYDYDPTRINSIGVFFTVPLPIFNTKRGEIMQREAEHQQAVLRVRQADAAIRQEVQAAIARLETTRASVETYSRQVLPHLEGLLREILNLFEKGVGGVDALKVIEIRRRLLTAREGRLAALWDLSQARADLAAAVGDPALALVPEEELPPPAPEAPPR